MTDTTAFGRPIQHDEPDWDPLRRAVVDTLTEDFMWMHAVTNDDGVQIHAYKHCDTRRYLHLDQDANAYRYQAGYDGDGVRSDYHPSSLIGEIEDTFAGLSGLGGATEQAVRAYRALLVDLWEQEDLSKLR